MRSFIAEVVRLWVRGSAPRFLKLARIALFSGGLLAPVIAALILAWPDHAEASTTYCGTHSNPGSGGGISYNAYIDIYADPVCSDDDIDNAYRYQAYDFYGTSSTFIDHHF